MRKFLITLLTVISFSIGFSDGKLLNFIETVLLENKVPNEHAMKIAQVIVEESKNIPQIDPFLVLALGFAETSFRNVYGDGGNAVGYFQLHQDAVFYVANFYEDVRQYKRENRVHQDLMKYPDWQTRIAYRYLYLKWKNVFNQDIILTISRYNGRKDKYNTYIAKVLKIFGEYVERYAKFLEGK